MIFPDHAAPEEGAHDFMPAPKKKAAAARPGKKLVKHLPKSHIHSMDQDTKKVTVSLPVGLLERAQGTSGRGITETITAALEEYARREAMRELADMRGKIEFDLDLEYTRQ